MSMPNVPAPSDMAAAVAAPSTLSRQCGDPTCTENALRGRGGLCQMHWEDAQRAVADPNNIATDSVAPIKTGTMRAPRKRCSVEGCEKVAKGRCEGRCQAHFKEYIATLEGAEAVGTDDAAFQAKRTKFFCSVDGCNRQSAGGCAGYCTRHYREINPDGNAAVRLSSMGKKCKYLEEDGGQCSKLAQGGCGGLCKRHWSISVGKAGESGATPDALGSGKKVARCKADGCGKYARRKGMCQKHWRETCPEEYKAAISNEGGEDGFKGVAGKKCSIEGCTKWARGKVGMCRRHARENGEYEPPAPSDVAKKHAEVSVDLSDPPNLSGAAEAAAEEKTASAADAKHGDVDAVAAADAAAEVVNEIAGADPSKCIVPTCEAPPGIGGYRGMCVAHWVEDERQKAAAGETPRRKRCSVPDCDKQAREFGMCHRHGRQHGMMTASSALQPEEQAIDQVMSPSKRRKMDTLAGVAASDVVAADVALDMADVAAAEIAAAADAAVAEVTGTVEVEGTEGAEDPNQVTVEV